jgi:hypothetical protein
MRLTHTTFLLVLMLLLSPRAFSEETTNDKLLKQCADKTIVVNREGQRVGEKLGGYCAAYLSATLDALKNTPGAKCKNQNEGQPEYLLSVYETYVKEKKVAGTDSASKTLLSAYRRALDCD